VDEYNLKPLSFPTIQAVVYHKTGQDLKTQSILDKTFGKDSSPRTDFFFCNDISDIRYSYDRSANDRVFKFKAIPSPKKICAVMVYIDPKLGDEWTNLSFGWLFRSVSIPDTIMDPIFNRKKDLEFLTKNGLVEYAHFFIHVKKAPKPSARKGYFIKEIEFLLKKFGDPHF